MDTSNLGAFDALFEKLNTEYGHEVTTHGLTNTSGSPDKRTKWGDKIVASSIAPNIDAVVLFALKKPELDMFIKACGISPIDDVRNNIVFRTINMDANGAPIRLALATQHEMGLVSASILSTISLMTYHPKLLLMGGICAGVEGKTSIGDLIVADPVFNYEAGKRTPKGFEANYTQRHLTRKCRELVEELKNDRTFLRTIKDSWDIDTGKPHTEIDVHIAPMGSGSSVLTEPKVLEDISHHQRKITGIDMESFAIGQSAYEVLGEETPWIVVKGVQDYANEDKNDKSREYAAYVSAKFIIEFLRRYFNM